MKLATRLVYETSEEMNVFRNSAEKTFQQIHTAALDFTGKFQVQIIMSKVTGRQVQHRMNIQTKSTEEYYRTSIFIHTCVAFLSTTTLISLTTFDSAIRINTSIYIFY